MSATLHSVPPRRLLVLGLAVVAASGCAGDDPFTPPAAGPRSELAIRGGGGVSTAYLLVGSAPELPGDLAARVRGSGGSVETLLPEIGVALVSSTDPRFAQRAASIGGIGWVAPDLGLRWIAPVRTAPLDSEMFGNPPTSGDDDFFVDLQWGLDAVDAPEAWTAGLRGNGARIAIIDSGIDSGHPDLAPNLNPALSASFVPGEAFDFVEPFPEFSHGTHVAGIAAAADNAFGVIGVAPEAEIVAIKVFSTETGEGNFSWLIQALVHAALVEADVANMSLGAMLSRRGEVFDAEGELVARVPARAIQGLTVALQRAAQFAAGRGVTLIASAGNQGVNGDRDKDRIHVPSDLPHVISISATGPNGWAVDPATDLDLRAFFTNFGRSTIDFAGPGGNVDFDLLASGALCTVGVLIPVTVPCWVFDLVFSTTSGSWAWAAGTSMAAPHATGVAALIVGANGGSMHPRRVGAALARTADDLGKPGNDETYGGGRVNGGNLAN